MQASFSSPSRAVLLYTPARRVFGPDARDTALGHFRNARDAVLGYDALFTAARAKLGRANRTLPENRRMAQGTAFRELNTLRAAHRRAVAQRDAAAAALLLLGGVLEPAHVAQAAALPAGCISLADDPDMASFGGRA